MIADLVALHLPIPQYPYIFVTERGWSIGNAGLPFIAVLIGFVLSIVRLYRSVLQFPTASSAHSVSHSHSSSQNLQPIAQYTSKLYTRAALASPNGRAPPEERLYFGMFGAALLPIALFWLGWTATPSIHWMAPTASGVLFGMGQLGLTRKLARSFFGFHVSRSAQLIKTASWSNSLGLHVFL